ncbi:MAG TPA: hypothetical protein VFH50_09740 [Acidimicrobiales bacterium]|nr:hypothetical protein [Acidimicrobiales bacterium]
MGRAAERLRFSREDPAEVVELMARLTAGRRGWANFEPEVPDDAEVPAPGLFGFFAARGPAVPLCTWVVETEKKGRRRPPSLGIQHATGTKAARRLADHGCPVPSGWRVTQDHPRRGLVVEVIPEEEPGVILAWLLDAGWVLCPAETTGWWNVVVHDDRA